MSKPVPLQHGCYYHIYNRGNNRENLFREERNYRHFLTLYEQYIPMVADTYAYCLLKNHFHLLISIKSVTEHTWAGKVLQPSQQFSNLFNAYSKAFNKAYERTGSLFEHPFERIEVTSNAYLYHLVTYIHHNPQTHGLIADFRNWRYSSYRLLHSTRSTFVRRDEVLGWFGGISQMRAAHEALSSDEIASLLLE